MVPVDATSRTLVAGSGSEGGGRQARGVRGVRTLATTITHLVQVVHRREEAAGGEEACLLLGFGQVEKQLVGWRSDGAGGGERCQGSVFLGPG